MQAIDIKVGDVIDGWTVIDRVTLVEICEGRVVALKLEVRVYDAVLFPGTKDHGVYIVRGGPRADWYRADEEVEVERADD